jgi:hypothetical protein
MNLKRLFKALFMLSAAAGLVWIVAGCEYTDSNPIWDPNANLGVFAAIKAVKPANRADVGVLEVDIRGQGFSSIASKNIVYFGAQTALIKACSDTQIVVYRPNVSGDAITVKVMVEGAYTIPSLKNYGVASVADLYGNMPGKSFSQFISVDKNDNVYFLAPNKNVSIVDAATQSQNVFGKRSFSPKATDMRLAPDGALYFAYANAALHKIEPAGGNSAKLLDMPAAFSTLDFDANGLMFAAGNKTGLMVLAPDKSTKTLSECNDLAVTYLAVFKKSVYVTDGNAIYRCAITGADGSVGGKQPVFDISKNATYAASKIVSFALTDDGALYVSTSHEHALFVVRTDGTTAPIYLGILAPAGGQLAWGGGTYFYLNMTQNSDINDLERITMGTKSAGK